MLAETVFTLCTSKQGLRLFQTRTISPSHYVGDFASAGIGWVEYVVPLVHLRRGNPRSKTGFAVCFS